MADKVANAVIDTLRKRGRVLVTGSALDWPAFVACCYGVYRAGCSAVPIDASAPAERLKAIVDDCSAAAVIGKSCENLAESLGLPAVGTDAIRMDHCHGDVGARVRARDEACVIYTSGSTGEGRGVVYSHGDLRARHGHSRLSPKTRARLLVSPSIGTSVAQGLVHDSVAGPHVFVVAPFDAHRFAQAIAAHRVTHITLVPAALTALLRAIGEDEIDVTSVRTVVSGSAHLPEDVFVRSCKTFPAARIWNSYGLTEGPTLAVSDMDRRRGAIGRLGAGTDVRIVHGGHSGTLIGDVGEIWLRSREFRSLRYVNEPSRDNEWIATGDAGYVDEAGYVHLVDRMSDVFQAAGRRVSSIAIETVISGFPGVRAAAVVGVPDERLGTRIAAFVEADNDVSLSELRRWGTERLHSFERPHLYRRVEQMPANVAGKTDKRALRSLAREPTPDSGERTRTLEQTVLAIWRELLGDPTLCLDDSLFDFGGRSLAAAEVAVRLSERTKRQVELGSVLEAETPRMLAETIRESSAVGIG